MRNNDFGIHKSQWNRNTVREAFIRRHRVDQKKVRASEGAVLGGTCRATNGGKRRNPHQRRQRFPVAVQFTLNGAESQRAEGRTAEAVRIEFRNHVLGVFKDQSSIIQAQNHPEGGIFRLNFNLLVARECGWNFRFQDEGEFSILRVSSPPRRIASPLGPRSIVFPISATWGRGWTTVRKAFYSTLIF